MDHLAIWCGADGTVRRLNGTGWLASLPERQPFVHLLDAGSRAKGALLLETIQREGAAVGWDLNVATAAGPASVRFSGARTGDEELCLLGERHPELYAEVARLNNELSNSQRELALRNKALERANHELGQFAARVAHDLHAPLRNIRELIRLFDTKTPTGEQAAAWLMHIAANAERMSRLVTGTLAYARAGRELDRFDPVPLDEVMATVAGGDARVRYGALPVVRGDRAQIERLFQNLLENAFAYRGTEPPVVEVSAERAGPLWRLAVRDNGMGIAPEHHETVFEMFRSLGRGGTGIGLATCRQVARRHGGEITLESAPGKGSVFYVTLPAAD